MCPNLFCMYVNWGGGVVVFILWLTVLSMGLGFTCSCALLHVLLSISDFVTRSVLSFVRA